MRVVRVRLRSELASDGAAEAEEQKWQQQHEDRLLDHRKRKKVKWKQTTLDGREFDSAD